MNDHLWRSGLHSIAATFCKTLSPAQADAVMCRIQHVNDMSLKFVLDRLRSEDKFPSNLGNAVLAAHRDWLDRNPTHRPRQDAAGCGQCEAGLIYVRRKGEVYPSAVFACAACDHHSGVPRSTTYQLRSAGWEIVRYAPSPQAQAFVGWVRQGHKPIDCLRHLLTGGAFQAVSSGRKDHEEGQAA